jgi:uncharacterized protein (AIM24 family)
MSSIVHDYTCGWCGAKTNPQELSCQACGASVDVGAVVTKSGWAQLPPRPDMARLQFGASACQIMGQYVPVVDFKLTTPDRLYFAHHLLLWKDQSLDIELMPMKGGFKRLLAGLPLVMTQTAGAGQIAFSRDQPGELIALPMQPRQQIDVKEHLFMVANQAVQYSFFSPDIWFTTGNGDDKETHYPVGYLMDRFHTAAEPGLLLLHAAGNVLVRNLAVNETILIKPSALIFKDSTVTMHLHFEHPQAKFTGWGSWGNRYLWLKLHGPGQVAAQSVFDRIEGESRGITASSSATNHQW